MKKKIILILLLQTFIKVEAQTSTFSVVDSLFAKGRYQKALKVLDEKEPSFISNYKTAVIYESIDNYEKAVEFLEKALLLKDDYQIKLKLAKAYQRLKKIDKSIKIYEDILAKDSLNLVLKYKLGKLYLISKKSKKAIKTFKSLIKSDEKNAHYSYQLALSYAIKKDRNRMINNFLDTYRKDTTHIKAIAHLASSFNKLRDKDSAKLFIDKGLVLDKNHVNLNKLKINKLYKDKQYAEVIPLLLNLDSIDIENTYSKTMLGRVFYNIDSLETAKKYFSKVYKFDNENFKSQTYLGHIALKQKKYKNAMFRYKMATKLGSKARDEEYYGLAMVYYKQNEPKLAITNFEKAYLENTKNYKALYHLAIISDDYYKDKKIAYKRYKKYLTAFKSKDKVMTDYIESRLSDIKKAYFMKGESLDD